MARIPQRGRQPEPIESKLSLVEAVENLSHLADMPIQPDLPKQEVEISAEEQALVQETLHQLAGTVGNPVDAIRETFQTILAYVSDYYRCQYSQLSNPQVRNNFRSLMAMVGEAGRKLDRCTGLFQTAYRASELQEYRALEDFFQNKLAKPIGESAQQNLEQLAKRELEGGTESATISLHARAAEDLERLIGDADYELFFLKREDGSSYFTPQLLRNLNVIHQLGTKLPEAVESDPLIQLREILDLEAHHRARALLEAARAYWPTLAKEANGLIATNPFFADLYSGMSALMLASNSRNLLAALPVKNTLQYFRDFALFLEQALSSPGYREGLAKQRPNHLESQLIGLTHDLCQTLFHFPVASDLIGPYITKLIKAGNPDTLDEPCLALRLMQEDQAIRTVLAKYPSGPLLRMLDFITAEDVPTTFEPLMQENFPSKLWTMQGKGWESDLLRLPSPTKQETVERVYPSRLFEGFLDSYLLPSGPERHLLINIQDRTSFRDYGRSLCLEQLPRLAEFLPHLTVITLAKNTDFYHQVEPYASIDSAEEFIDTLCAQMVEGEVYGFYFPPGLRTGLNQRLHALAKRLWQERFGSAKSLERDQRLAFIELFYNELVVDLLEDLKPQSFSFTDKDGVDDAPCATTLFYLQAQWAKDPSWRPASEDLLHTMLFAPALMIRERAPHPLPLARMAQAAYLLQTGRVIPLESMEGRQ
jgi:hypothetical protein